MNDRIIGGGVRTLGWLAVASMLAVAMLAPASAMALTGAVYTSNFDGSIINANVDYPSKDDVYLTGGPCNGGSHLAAGDYYFEVTSPNGTLLSSDAIGQRRFTVANDFIQSTAGSHVTFPVNCNPAVTGITIQLMPYADTPNPGGEYKLAVATASSVEACAGFDATSTSFKFCNGADQKSDNFKVAASQPTDPPVTDPPVTDPPVTDPPVTDPPVTEPPASPTGGVEAETGTPTTTLPPTDGIEGTAAPATDTWRIVLIAMAGLLASALVLTPAKATRRR